MSFAWRKPPVGTSIVVWLADLKVEDLVMVYDRKSTGGGWWKPGRVTSLSPEGCIVWYRATPARTVSALFKLERVRKVVSPALAARVQERLLGVHPALVLGDQP